MSDTKPILQPVPDLEPRRGDWIQTFTGKQFYPLDPRPEEVDQRDIARALSFKARWGGHSKRFVSVAEHCLRVSQLTGRLVLDTGLPARDLWLAQIVGLLHDAGEAYLADVPRPVKRYLWARDLEVAEDPDGKPHLTESFCDPWPKVEARVDRAIAEHFGLETLYPARVYKSVKQADDYLMAIEAHEISEPGTLRLWHRYPELPAASVIEAATLHPESRRLAVQSCHWTAETAYLLELRRLLEQRPT